jgi:hypothetical protein
MSNLECTDLNLGPTATGVPIDALIAALFRFEAPVIISVGSPSKVSLLVVTLTGASTSQTPPA